MRDLSKLKIAPITREQEIDPIKIFASRTQRGAIEGLYGPQQEALTSWHLKRDKPDILFSLPTGGGKTLVGLLAAQSIVNEKRGKVLYACATNQLVDQARSQAEQCGITVATYYDGKWHNQDLFQQGHVCLVTNYHVLFNGRSRYLNEKIDGVIFDDAHVAPNIIRDCFTLTIDSEHPAWEPLLQCLGPYFEKTSFYPSFRKILAGQGYDDSILFVPTWFIADNVNQISSALDDNNVEELNTGFPYAHLRLHLNHCCFFVTHNRIEIGPTVIPTHTMPYFQQGVRRIYMTATLPSRYECIRTFGVDRAEPIVPTGKAGAAQRLFVFSRGKGASGLLYDEVRKLIEPKKTCIIVPSGWAAKKWLDIAALYDSKKGHDSIKEFATATDARKLVFAALYDGIDLPGKSCNVLVLDGLPRGSSLHDRFIERALDVSSLKASAIAARVVQSVGRIFRSNTDHGVVVLADLFQQQWMIGPDHLQYMPPLLQQQIRLGYEIRKLVDQGAVAYDELMEAVINGRPDWDAFYNKEITKLQTEGKPKEPKWTDDLAKKEYEAFRHLWDGRNSNAAECLAGLAREVEQHEPTLAAWFTHWSALALKIAGDRDNSMQLYQHAANTKIILGRLPGGSGDKIEKSEPGPQAHRAAANFKIDILAKLRTVEQQLAGDGGPNADDHEDALKALGELLGFVSSRPDEEKDTGPDVLWTLPESNVAVSLETKTQKKDPKAYKKKVIGKLHDDCSWLDSNYSRSERRIYIVGPLVPVVKQANPKPDYRVMPLHELRGLASRTGFALQTIASNFNKKDLPYEIEMAFRFNGLLWPACIDALTYRLAVDLQSELDDEDVSE